MKEIRQYVAMLLLAACCFAAGRWSSQSRVVRAASDDPQFQIQILDTNSTLLVYYPSQKALYAYKGALTGNNALQCNYQFRMSEPGGVIRRENCAVQKLFP